MTGGSIAEEAGVQAGDLLKYINGKPTTHFTHMDAQKCIASSGNYLTLTVVRWIYLSLSKEIPFLVLNKKWYLLKKILGINMEILY